MTPEQLEEEGVLGTTSEDIFLHLVWETPRERLHCLTKRLGNLQIHELTKLSTSKSQGIPEVWEFLPRWA